MSEKRKIASAGIGVREGISEGGWFDERSVGVISNCTCKTRRVNKLSKELAGKKQRLHTLLLVRDALDIEAVTIRVIQITTRS